MKGLTSGSENGKRNGVIGLGLGPDHGPPSINIKVSHGNDEHGVTVPSNSSFGDLKSVIARKIGLSPDKCKLLFRGKEKEDDEDLQTAGVKENSKVLLFEVMSSEQESPEEIKEPNVISKGGEAVAEVRKEVDKLSEQVVELQAVLDSGAKVDDKKIIYLTEMLMRQLLKLDGIEAEGEGRVQRKMEVRRVQNLVETMDILKSRNSNPSTNSNNTAPVSTQWESFELSGDAASSSTILSSAHSSVSSPAPAPSPAPAISPSPSPAVSPSPYPYPVPPAAPDPLSSSSPSHVPSSSHSPVPAYDSTAASSYDPNYAPSYTPSSMPYYAPSRQQSYGVTPMPSYNPFPYAPSPTPSYSSSPYPPTPMPAYNHSTHVAQYLHHMQPHAPYPEPSHTPYPPQFYTAHPSQSYQPFIPSHVSHPIPSYDPSFAPAQAPHPTPSHAPHSTPSHAPSSVRSSTKVTQDWEHFE